MYIFQHFSADRYGHTPKHPVLLNPYCSGCLFQVFFLSKEEKTEKLLVIDGQQRLRTLQWFYEGIFEKTGREFVLKEVQAQFEGLNYRSLKASDRRRLDDSVLHATIIKQDEPSEDVSSIYHIFERLNTGGTRLTPQEIRAAIYHGEFNDLIRTLNYNKSWRELFGKPHTRMRDQELILRFLALYYCQNQYERSMKSFLNMWMGANRNPNSEAQKEITDLFTNTVEVILKCLGKNAFKPKRALNAAVFDSIMVGVARRLAKGPISNREALQKRYSYLMRAENFVAAIEKSTADEERVKARMNLAIQAFADVS
jgi:hypothetical protein